MVLGVRSALPALLLLIPALLLAMAPEAHGQNLNARVVLALAPDSATVCPGVFDKSFFRVNPDGSLGGSPFVVPNNKALVVTDVQWIASPEPTAFTPGRATRLSLSIRSATIEQIVYDSPPVFITAANQNASVGGADHLTTGFIVGPGNILCPFVSSSGTFVSATNSATRVFLYGYLIND